MTRVEIEMLSVTTNCPVLTVPGRSFPGVVIQGDSLKSLFGIAEEIEKASNTGDVDELRESIIALKNKLGGYLEEYEGVMKAHGRELPYVK
jgi:hypothetical protein